MVIPFRKIFGPRGFYIKMIAAIETFKKNGIIPVSVSMGHIPHYWIEHLILSGGGIEEHRKNLKDAVPESRVTA